LIKKEKISVSEEEFKEEVNKIAESYNVEEERLEAYKEGLMQSSKSYIEETLQKRKAIDMLVENAIFVDAPEKTETDAAVEAAESAGAAEHIKDKE